jgi:hypothetical protein
VRDRRLRKKLARVTTACPLPPFPAEPQPAAANTEEPREVAGELAAAFGRMVGYYREHYKLTPEEACARAAEAPDHYIERVLTCPAEEVSWHDLDALEGRDPARALERWEEVKRAARGELRSGFRAARALEGCESHCRHRARFLAVRAELSEAWRPRNAAEQHLVDQMAQCQELIWRWQETLTAYTELSFRGWPRPAGEGPPRLSDAEAFERAAAMVERFHRMYLRSLQALQELRRRPALVVRSAGQINIAQQQVNVAGG